MRLQALALALLGTVTLAVTSAPAATSQDPEAVALTRDAAKLIQGDRLGEALELLERARAVDPEYWEAPYQLGRLRGKQASEAGGYDEHQRLFALARDALLEAARLNPGHDHTHYLAFLAAYELEDWETAWDQAIKASHAGRNMNDRFLEMYHRAPPPEDFEVRIQAPRIFVGYPESSSIEHRSEVPFNRNPQSGGIGTLSGRPATIQGRDRLHENAADIRRLQRIVREVLAGSPHFGIVLDPQQADYVLGISIDELGESAPVYLEGYLRLYDPTSGEAVYFRSIELPDIAQRARVEGQFGRWTDDLAAWIRDQRQR